jgi:hypothetical protein
MRGMKRKERRTPTNERFRKVRWSQKMRGGEEGLVRGRPMKNKKGG